MTRRRPEEPEIVMRDFSPEEISLGIEKLRRRIAEVQGLRDGVAYSDQRVKNAEKNIRDTVREVFGPRSPEFGDHEHHDIWHGSHNYMDHDDMRQAKFRAGVPQSVTMLEGLISRLEEKRADAAASPDAGAKVSFEGLSLHQRIADACVDQYRDGHYESAVFAASRALVNYVKERSGKHELDGSKLMTTVFSKNNPILAFNDLNDDSDRDEQEGMMYLFMGAVLGIRNPRGHAGRDDTAQRGLEHIMLLSLLANRVVMSTFRV